MIDIKKKRYDPRIDGRVKAMRIFNNNHEDVVLARLVFRNQDTDAVIIDWNDIEERYMYESGIDGDTLIYDDREKPDFDTFEVEKSEPHPYFTQLMTNLSKRDLVTIMKALEMSISQIKSLIYEFKDRSIANFEPIVDSMRKCSNDKETLESGISKINDMIRSLEKLTSEIDDPYRIENNMEDIDKIWLL